jgi:hypothetical protein
MANMQKDLAFLRDPSNIKKAGLASSPYVLRKIFAADQTIQRLIKKGEGVIPLIQNEIHKNENLGEITLSAFAFIIENVRSEKAPDVLGNLFQKSIKKPGPFFVHFAAHAIRSGLKISIKPLEMFYSPAELIQTQKMLH